MPNDAKKPAPFFATPGGMVALALLLWVLACVLAALAVVVLDQIAFANETSEVVATYVAFSPSTVAVLMSLVFMIVGSVRWAVFGRRALPSVNLNLTRELGVLESINQRLLLSETAKKISYRADDLAVLRKTLKEDIQKGEYDAAMVLVTDLASAYGQLEEAEQFRAQIDDARRKDQEAKVASGIKDLEAKLADRDFAAAGREAARLQRLYPDAPAVADLPQRVDSAKEQYKHELERAFLHAKDREEIDRALDILKVLDKMLTHEEAEPFREVARDVLGKKRDNLGVQFKLAVHDREWRQAVAAGEQIIKQFPNSRMADEVRQSIDQLRANAAGQQNANLTPGMPPAPGSHPTPGGPPPAPANPAGGSAPNTGISFTTTD
ncbi:MAG: hypothetical protein AAFX76_06765 [Planctomycetota bacterium]